MTHSDLPSTRVLAILASSRRNGNTEQLLQRVLNQLPDTGLVDLSAHSIVPYDYEQDYSDGDGFDAIAAAMVRAEVIIFASPVYWYSMSGPMKIFFDRLTDLTEKHKAMGKSLKGKTIFLVSTGGSPQAPASFAAPFVDSAGYFDMHWGGMLYGQAENPTLEAIEEFTTTIANIMSSN